MCCAKCQQPYKSKSGRKLKGRGVMRYRTPSQSGGRSGSETPPHWKQEQSRIRHISDIKGSKFAEYNRASGMESWKIRWIENWIENSQREESEFPGYNNRVGVMKNWKVPCTKNSQSWNADNLESDMASFNLLQSAEMTASSKSPDRKQNDRNFGRKRSRDVFHGSLLWCKVVKDIEKEAKEGKKIRRTPSPQPPTLPKVEVIKPKKDKTLSSMLLMNYIQCNSSDDSEKNPDHFADSSTVTELDKKKNNQPLTKNFSKSSQSKSHAVVPRLEETGSRAQKTCKKNEEFVKQQVLLEVKVMKHSKDLTESHLILMNYFQQGSSDTNSEQKDSFTGKNVISKLDNFKENSSSSSVKENAPPCSMIKCGQKDSNARGTVCEKTENSVEKKQNLITECQTQPQAKVVKSKKQKSVEELWLSNYFHHDSSEDESDTENSPTENDTSVPKLNNLNKNSDTSILTNEQGNSLTGTFVKTGCQSGVEATTHNSPSVLDMSNSFRYLKQIDVTGAELKIRSPSHRMCRKKELQTNSSSRSPVCVDNHSPLYRVCQRKSIQTGVHDSRSTSPVSRDKFKKDTEIYENKVSNYDCLQ